MNFDISTSDSLILRMIFNFYVTRPTASAVSGIPAPFWRYMVLMRNSKYQNSPANLGFMKNSQYDSFEAIIYGRDKFK